MTMKTVTKPDDMSVGADAVSALVSGIRPHKKVGFANILTCLDASSQDGAVLAWANALSRYLHARLRALSVLETTPESAAPLDPINVEMRRLATVARIARLSAQAGLDEEAIAGIEVAVGPVQQRVTDCLGTRKVDLCVISANSEGKQSARVLGDMARHIVETAPCSVLLVPPSTSGAAAPTSIAIRRLMVPLDCSRRAESALPAAIAIADAFDAETVMAHALPEPMITEIGPPDATGIALRQTVAKHNHDAAARYMSLLRARLVLERRAIRTLIVNGADPRHRLARVASEEAIDLVVISAKGAGSYADQRLGSVTDYLVNHIRLPLLIVRAGCTGQSSVDIPMRPSGAERLRPDSQT